ncbi:restriction endonuclease [Candidatus Dojkabacteria bacterium]|nr:restriction endonuclease [Candidatus Dojkabacteria bacterium]
MRQKEQNKLDKYKKVVSKRLAELQDYKDVEPLEDKEWGEFFIQDVATIESGRDIYAKERISGNTPYVSSTANNNGIGYFVSNDNKTKEAGCLSVNRNGSVGYSFYHSYEALFSNDCRKLRLNNPSKHIGIFISQQITRQRAKYGYGYKMGTARLKRQKIMLPMNNQNQPDFEYMENYMKCLEYNKIKKYLDYKK